MIKKYWKHSIYLRHERSFLKQLLNKTFTPTKESQNLKKKLCVIDKFINDVQLLVQSDGKIYYCCEDLLAHMIEITAMYLKIYDNVFLAYLKFILL